MSNNDELDDVLDFGSNKDNISEPKTKEEISSVQSDEKDNKENAKEKTEVKNPENKDEKDEKDVFGENEILLDGIASSDGMPGLKGNGYPSDYMSLYENVKMQYKKLPQLDEKKLYEELSSLNIKINPVSTPQVISLEIQKVQAHKDRLSEIYTDVLRNFFIKKRLVDVLRESWGKYSSEKSADKRNADCLFRTSEFEVDFSKVETLFRVCNHIIRNLDSMHDSLSRRLTVMQLEIKLHDGGRTGMPDYNFDKESENNPFEKEEKEEKDFDEKRGLPPVSESF